MVEISGVEEHPTLIAAVKRVMASGKAEKIALKAHDKELPCIWSVSISPRINSREIIVGAAIIVVEVEPTLSAETVLRDRIRELEGKRLLCVQV